MIILDTETTGLLLQGVADPNTQPRIIDLALVKIDDATGEEVGRLETLLNPGVPLSEEITRITGLRDADLATAPPFTEMLQRLRLFMLGEWSALAHNWPFDQGMLWWELVRCGAERAFPWPPLQLCTVQLYEPEFGHRPKLTQLYERKLGRKLEQKHRAMADVEALLEVVRADRLYELGQH